MRYHDLCSLLTVGATCLGSSVAVRADDATVQELEARIRELEATVHRLSASAEDDWLTERRAAEIRALVHDVLADADTRASLLTDEIVAGHDGKFFVASADGNFRLNIGGQLQFRFVYNSQSQSPDDDDRWGFENRRTKLRFSGHVVDPTWKFNVLGAFNRDGGDLKLQTAAITKVLGDNWEVRIGQFKPPFMREASVSSRRQLAVERSLINAEFGQKRAQGVKLSYEDDLLAVQVMYGDGFGTANTPALERDTEFAITGRAELLVAGRWKQFNDFTSPIGDDLGLLLGAAVHYENDEFGTDDVEEELLTMTLDGSLEVGGWNAFAAFVYRTIDVNGGGVPSPDQFGFVVQGGFFFVPDEWEVFVRYEWGDLDEPDQDDLSVITAGVNRYFAKHALKWTTDIGLGFDPVSSDWASSGAGWRTDAPGEDTQIVLRSQLQLLF